MRPSNNRIGSGISHRKGSHMLLRTRKLRMPASAGINSGWMFCASFMSRGLDLKQWPHMTMPVVIRIRIGPGY